MTTTQAKEILELNVKEAGKKMPADTLDALKMAIDALSYVDYDRSVYPTKSAYLLEGETPWGESP